MRLKHGLSKLFQLLFALVAIVSAVSTIFPAVSLAAPVNTNLSSASPSPAASMHEASGANDKLRHLLIYSDHGKVDALYVKLYYNDGGGHTLNVQRDSGTVCNIYNYANYHWNHNYIALEFNGAGSAGYSVLGNNMCGGGSGFYGNFAVPGGVYNSASGYYEVNLKVHFAALDHMWNGSDCPGGGQSCDQKVSFELNAPGGIIGNIATTDRNYSVVGKKDGAGGYIQELFTFGLNCSVASAQDYQPVNVYDVDNSPTDPNPVIFYVATVAPAAAGGGITPLAAGDYEGGVIDAHGATTHPNGAGPGRPSFQPGNYTNKGGVTQVHIRMQPGQRYALIVDHVDTNGEAGSNNFINIGVPGDGIFGAADFKCPVAHIRSSVAINASGNTFYANKPTTFTPYVYWNGGGAVGNVANYQIKYWYSPVNDSSGPGANTAYNLSANSGVVTPGSNISSPAETRNLPPLASNTRYLCAKTYLTAGDNTVVDTMDGQCVNMNDTRPYLKSYGGDVEAGFGAGDTATCTSNSNAKIIGWNTDSGSYGGAGSEFGVQAMNIIRGFASAQGGSSPNSPAAGVGLTFANKNVTVSGDSLGGSFNAATPCHNYLTDALNTPSLVTLGSVGSTGIQTLSGETIPVGTQKTVLVYGNAYISAPITYSAGNYSLATIPSYRLIVVGGDLYIDASIGQLDGLYVSQPSMVGGSLKGGNIYTCALNQSGAISQVAESSMYNSCNSQLRVNGSFVAKQVFFQRTKGTLDGIPGSDATTDTTRAATASSNAAEMFVYSADQWLAPSDQASSGGGKIQAYTSLPPTISGN